MNRIQTVEHLLHTIGADGLQALIAEGLRRRLNIREVARHLHIPLDNAKFFAIGYENAFQLQPGERIRALVPSAFGWQGYGTVIEQSGDLVRFREDGKKPGTSEFNYFGRDQVELTDLPELLPDGAFFDDCYFIAIPCKLSPSGKQLEFYCPHCRTTHRHGLPGGYVGAHCTKRDSPLRAMSSIYVFPGTEH